MPFDATTLPQYIQNLLAEADLKPEDLERLSKAVASDSVVKKANELALPRSDYSRTLDEQRTKHDSEREQWTKEKGDYRVWFEKQKERIATWEASHGGNPNNATPTPDPNTMRQENGRFITVDQLDTLKQQWLKEIDGRFEKQGEAVLGVTEDYISLAADFTSRFQKKLPVEEVRKKAIEEGTNLRIAYERYIQPEVDKQKKEEFDRLLAAAKDEGAREAMTRMHNPANPGALDGHPVFGRRDLPQDWKKMSSEERDAASQAKFEQHWNETQGFTKTAT